MQKVALDPILSGADCVVEAPTAGGKTEAVLFPSLTRAAQNRVDAVQILYLAPLRALLNNLEMRGETYATCCGLHAFKWHGDVSQTKKVAQLKEPPQLLLTTPESVEAILLRKAGWRRFFEGLETVIIDEAHNFAGSDRGGHLLALLERLEEGTGHSPQRIALSATVGNPEAMCQWLTGSRAPAQRIHVADGEANETDYRIHHFDDSDETEDTPYPERAVFRLLETIKQELAGNRGIVFVRSRSKAEDIAKALQQFTNNGLNLRTHHSAVSKFFREEAEQLIQLAGEQGIEAIISTSTLELGIDIGELDRVLQMDALASPSAFLQRVGRTGRRPGKPRHFRGLTRDPEDLLVLAATVSLGEEHRSNSLRLPTKAFHLLAHQLLCMALQEHGVTPGQAWRTLSRAYAFSAITEEQYLELIEHMRKEAYLRQADGVLVPGEAAERRYLTGGWRQLFAVFNTAPLYEVFEARNQVGTLDIGFVEGLEAPFHFTLAGRLWKAEKIETEAKRIHAKRAEQGVAPKWSSFGGPDVPYETAQRVGELLHGHKPLPEALDDLATATLKALQTPEGSAGNWNPRGVDLLASSGGKVIIRTYAGDAINRTLARLLESRGMGTSGNYAEVTVEDPGTQEPNEADSCVSKALQELASGTDGHRDSEEALIAKQKAWRFSPFAPMLPDKHTKAAIVDDTLDAEGLEEVLTQLNP